MAINHILYNRKVDIINTTIITITTENPNAIFRLLYRELKRFYHNRNHDIQDLHRHWIIKWAEILEFAKIKLFFFNHHFIYVDFTLQNMLSKGYYTSQIILTSYLCIMFFVLLEKIYA